MSITIKDKVIETDEEGYLLNRDDCSEEVTEKMATLNNNIINND